MYYASTWKKRNFALDQRYCTVFFWVGGYSRFFNPSLRTTYAFAVLAIFICLDMIILESYPSISFKKCSH